MEEIWKPIKDFEDYQISSFGRVKSLKFGKERILKLCIDSHNYYYVCINKKTFRVHQLIAFTFLKHKPYNHKLVVNHKDFNRLNNHIDNLEIVTNRENCNKKHIKSSSKYTGVSWVKSRMKWNSYIFIYGKQKNLGYFDTEILAHIAYQDKLKEINY